MIAASILLLVVHVAVMVGAFRAARSGGQKFVALLTIVPFLVVPMFTGAGVGWLAQLGCIRLVIKMKDEFLEQTMQAIMDGRCR